MAKTKQKTTETKKSVEKFIRSVPDPVMREDSLTLIKIMQEASGFEPKMWGPSIIGFGTYHYKYDSGHEGNAPLIGFSPRKAAISLYMMGMTSRDELLKKFGKHKTAKACIYVKKLADIDLDVLKKMAALSLRYMKSKYK